MDAHSHLQAQARCLLYHRLISFGTCNHVLWVSQAGKPFHMFSREALPLGNFPTRYSGARCPSLTPQIRTTTATLGNRSHRHSVLSQHSGWRMLPAVFALLYTSLEFAALVPVPAAAMTPALSGLGPTSAQDG